MAVGDAPGLAGLEAAGFSVLRTDGTGDTVVRALDQAPAQVVFVTQQASAGGRAVTVSLRAHGRSFLVPLVGLVSDDHPLEALKWISVGAVDVWRLEDPSLAAKTEALIDECATSGVQGSSVAARWLRFARRAALSGVLAVYARTPFEGSARFVDGTLLDAALGPLRGEEALERLCEHEAPLQWTTAQVSTPSQVLAASTTYRRRALVVEDVETVARQEQAVLERAGYQVDVAFDGRTGLNSLRAGRYDLAVVDLDLPVLDGWGLLRHLRDDVMARECPVLVRSGQDAWLEALEAAQAGARAWLRKSGEPKELVHTAAQLVQPRLTVWEALSATKEAVTADLALVGPVWTLRVLAELDLSGRLVVRDELSQLEAAISHGRLLFCVGQAGTRLLSGPPALEALLRCRGTAVFTPGEHPEPPAAAWLEEWLRPACEALNARQRARLERAVAAPSSLVCNPELARLFMDVGTTLELKVLDGLDHVKTLEELAVRCGRPVPAVREVLCELTRREVLVPRLTVVG